MAASAIAASQGTRPKRTAPIWPTVPEAGVLRTGIGPGPDSSADGPSADVGAGVVPATRQPRGLQHAQEPAGDAPARREDARPPWRAGDVDELGAGIEAQLVGEALGEARARDAHLIVRFSGRGIGREAEAGRISGAPA